MPIKDLLPYDLREKADLYTKGTDTMDVWFDSGTSWAGFLNIWIFIISLIDLMFKAW
jgi:isoleucyl-tRNA synthetase